MVVWLIEPEEGRTVTKSNVSRRGYALLKMRMKRDVIETGVYLEAGDINIIMYFLELKACGISRVQRIDIM